METIDSNNQEEAINDIGLNATVTCLEFSRQLISLVDGISSKRFAHGLMDKVVKMSAHLPSSYRIPNAIVFPAAEGVGTGMDNGLVPDIRTPIHLLPYFRMVFMHAEDPAAVMEIFWTHRTFYQSLGCVPLLGHYFNDFNASLRAVLAQLLLYFGGGAESISVDFPKTKTFREFGFWLLVDPKATLRELALLSLGSGKLSLMEVLRHFPAAGRVSLYNFYSDSSNDDPKEEFLLGTLLSRLKLEKEDSKPGLIELALWIREYCASCSSPFSGADSAPALLAQIDEFITNPQENDENMDQ